MTNPGLYMIMTRPKIGYRAFTEICVKEGLPLIQLRDKSLDDRSLLELARELKDICRGSDSKLIINDRPDIALMARADGYHLGINDLSLKDVRSIEQSGTPLISGLSSHSPEQAGHAWNQKPDYIGFGPVFSTPTKAIPDPPVGLEHIEQISRKSPCPVIFIGGLFPENIEEVLRRGAKNLCLVRYFNDSTEPVKRIREIRQIIDGYCENSERSE